MIKALFKRSLERNGRNKNVLNLTKKDGGDYQKTKQIFQKDYSFKIVTQWVIFWTEYMIILFAYKITTFLQIFFNYLQNSNICNISILDCLFLSFWWLFNPIPRWGGKKLPPPSVFVEYLFFAKIGSISNFLTF